MNITMQRGNLVNNIEMNATKGGTTVGSFRLAVQRSFKNKNGERDTDFHSCVMYGKRVESLNNFIGKGSQVIVTGELQNDNYKDENDKWHYGYQIHVNDLEIIKGKNSGQGQQSTNSGGQQQASKPKQNPFANESTQTNISDDDLPF